MNFRRNFVKFDDFGHVRNFLTNEIQNPRWTPFLPIYTQHGMPRQIGVLASCPHASTRQHCSLAPSPHQPRRSIQCSCCRLVFLRSYVPPHPLVFALNCCHRRRAMSGSCGFVAGVQESGTFLRGFLPGCHFLG